MLRDLTPLFGYSQRKLNYGRYRVLLDGLVFQLRGDSFSK